jgi:hypothetical protein
MCEDLTIAAWLNALERFISRCGKPETISCDNGSTFVGGNRKLRRLVREQLTARLKADLTDAVEQRFQIRFSFIPVGMPHYGGLWERLIRQVQQSILKSVKTVSKMTRDAFTTFLARAELAVNLRPLAIDDDLGVITPMSILGPATSYGYGFESGLAVSRVMGQLRQAIDYFWRLWGRLYLHELSPHRVRPGAPEYVELKVGDAVLFEKLERFHRLPGSTPTAGTIAAVHLGNDGIARRYDIVDGAGKLFDVPVRRIFLAEQDLVEARQTAIGRPPEPTALSDS